MSEIDLSKYILSKTETLKLQKMFNWQQPPMVWKRPQVQNLLDSEFLSAKEVPALHKVLNWKQNPDTQQAKPLFLFSDWKGPSARAPEALQP